MLKRYMLLAVATVFLMFQLFTPPATAAVLDEATRTVALSDSGETLVMTVKQTINGRDKFLFACAKCHVGGDTKTNPSISLSPGDLAGANPIRNNIEGLCGLSPQSHDL